MIAQREQSDTVVVRSGVSDDDLARIVALTGLGPAGRADGRAPAADDHPVAVAARLEASVAAVRALLVLLTLVVLGGLAVVLV